MSTFSAFVIDGITTLVATGLVVTFVAPPGVVPHASNAPPPRAVILTAQTQPLPVQLLNEQIAFNVGLAVNFVTTGATLAQRIAQIPGVLVSDVRHGTPLPTATAEALTAFANIEFQAGRDLVGYGGDIVNFQIRFLTRVLSALSPFASGPRLRGVSAATTRPTKTKVLQQHSTIIGPSHTASSHHESKISESANRHSQHAKGTRTHRH